MNAVTRVGFILVIALKVWGDTPAFQPPSLLPGGSATFTGTRGQRFFYSYISGYYVTKLGIFDANGDGLANAHQVGLWTSTGTLLRSAMIPAGTEAPLENGYRYVSIAPLALVGGTFVVGAQFSVDDADQLVGEIHAPGTLAPHIHITSPGQYAIGPDLPFPNIPAPSPGEGVPAPIFWEANFQVATVIPEPSVCVLLSLAMVSLLFCRGERLKGPLSSVGPSLTALVGGGGGS